MTKTITKQTLANNIFYETGLPTAMAEEIVNDLFSLIINNTANEGSVKIAKFGSFYAKQKSARMGRDLNTQQDKLISARKVVSFIPSNQLKRKINGITDS